LIVENRRTCRESETDRNASEEDQGEGGKQIPGRPGIYNEPQL